MQETLKTLYLGIGGEYYFADDAWKYLQEKTEIDLLSILERIASEREY